jgi:hypothetical protein
MKPASEMTNAELAVELGKAAAWLQPVIQTVPTFLREAASRLQAPAVAEVKVKPLEWEPHHAAGQPRCPVEFANTAFGISYLVSEEGWWRFPEELRPCNGLEASKAAVQADHDERIRSALRTGGSE